MINTKIITKSRPRVIPKKLANEVLKFGKSANTLTKIQNMDHRITVVKEFFLFMYLNIIPTIAIKEIIGNIKEYNNIVSPFKIDVLSSGAIS